MEEGEMEEEDPLIVAQREREAAERAKEAPAEIPPYDEEALEVGAGLGRAGGSGRAAPPQHLALSAATARAANLCGCPLHPPTNQPLPACSPALPCAPPPACLPAYLPACLPAGVLHRPEGC
jgi:hypothetical protein